MMSPRFLSLFVIALIFTSRVHTSKGFFVKSSVRTNSRHSLIHSSRTIPPLYAASPHAPPSPTATSSPSTQLIPLLLLAVATAQPLPAAALDAAAASTSVNPIASAFVAYGHYLGLVLVAASLAAERVLIKPAMSTEEEKLLGTVDIVYGLAGVLVLATGYLRVTQYGKGWEVGCSCCRLVVVLPPSQVS